MKYMAMKIGWEVRRFNYVKMYISFKSFVIEQTITKP